MPIRITGSQTIVPGEILAAVVGDPATTSTVSVSTSFTNFLTNLNFTSDRRNIIISAYFWIDKSSTSSDEEIVVRLTESGTEVANTARRFHIFGNDAGGLMLSCQWSLQVLDGSSYSYRPQILKSGNQTIAVRAGDQYPMYLFQAIGL